MRRVQGFRDLGLRGLAARDLGFRDMGFRDLGFRDMGFRDLGFRGLGFRCLGFRSGVSKGGGFTQWHVGGYGGAVKRDMQQVYPGRTSSRCVWARVRGGDTSDSSS